MVGTPIDGLDPVELTAFARLAQADFDAQAQALARFLPYQPVADIRYRYQRGVDALVDAAKYRAFDAESHLARRPGTGRVSGELLPISLKIPLAEYDQLRLRNAPNAEIVDGVFGDAARLARSIAASTEMKRGELLQSGKIALNENGVLDTYDAGRHASLTIPSVSPLWSVHNTATPIANVMAWNELIYAQTGLRANRLLVSGSVMVHLQQCDEVRGTFVALANAPTRATREQVNEAFVAMAGVTIEVYVPPAGLTTAPINASWVVLLADNIQLGATMYGTTLEAQEPEYSTLGSQPGVVAGGWKEKDPITVWSHAAAIVLPVASAPDLTLGAKVIA